MLIVSLLSVGSCREFAPAVWSETRDLMGTLVSVTLVHPDREFARAALEEAFAAMEAVDESMSTYRPQSEISRLNREGTLEAGEAFLSVLRSALEFHRLSRGAFDVTMMPLLELQRASFAERGEPPSRPELEAVLGRIDAGAIRIEGTSVSLPAGMAVTFDGIAKGFAIDRAIEALRDRGVSSALVDAGGDVRALGDKAGVPWQVAMQDPRDATRYLQLIELRDRAVATSGDYRRYFDPEMRYHHILDPRTGESAEELISVSILAPTAMQADALATAVFVLGAQEGLALVERLEGIEAFVVTDGRELLKSSGW